MKEFFHNYERVATPEDLKALEEMNVKVKDLAQHTYIDPENFQPYVIYNNIRYNL